MSLCIISWLKRHAASVWWILWIGFLTPAIELCYRYSQHALGSNPLQVLQHSSGKLALGMLIITLSVTPLRHGLAMFCRAIKHHDGKRFADWNWLMRARKMMGLYCFFYALLHLGIYLALDVGFNGQWLLEDIGEKRYIITGFTAFVLLSVLAVTSTTRMKKILGGARWKRLHRFTYLLAILLLIHFWQSSKVGVYSAAPYSFMVALLLLYRLLIFIGAVRSQVIENPDGIVADARDYKNNKRSAADATAAEAGATGDAALDSR
jgi:sulfoxide reductase heme-binding subunit YedZ